MGGKFLLKLNIYGRPIANKYREGKMKRTLKRELKVLEIVKREGMETSVGLCYVTFGCLFCLRRRFNLVGVGFGLQLGGPVVRAVSASVWSVGESLSCGKSFRGLKRFCSTLG